MFNNISGLLSGMEEGQIVLPAMQRGFVWDEDRIKRLFDSLLRRFPIGIILLWQTNEVKKFRSFRREVSEDMDITFETSEDNRSRYMVLDGQQRLQSLLAAINGTYEGRKMSFNIFSGPSDEKDAGDEYYDFYFLSDGEVANSEQNESKHLVSFGVLVKYLPEDSHRYALLKIKELGIPEESDLAKRVIENYLKCASILANDKAIKVYSIGDDLTRGIDVKEVLEIFVRINTAGLTLHKADLLVSLLGFQWGEVLTDLQELTRRVNAGRPYEFTRDDILKSLLLANRQETRFDKLVSDWDKVEKLAPKLLESAPAVEKAWKKLGVILNDDCKIYSERFFRGGHKSLLPFVYYLYNNREPSHDNMPKLTTGIYLSIMSGIFAGAEARMGKFSRDKISNNKDFPLKELAVLIKNNYGIDSLDELLRRHRDLALNIAHGGISLKGEELERDHIFPRSKLEDKGYKEEDINHYANFHFLRKNDNRNKGNKWPSVWFKNPGRGGAYSDEELKERLLNWESLKTKNFKRLIESRGKNIRDKALDLFAMTEDQFNGLFEDGV